MYISIWNHQANDSHLEKGKGAMRKIIIIFLIAALISSCASTKIKSVVDSNYQSKNYTDILILSTFSDLIYKSAIEDKCLKYCRWENINAYTGSELIPSTREYSNSEINKIMKENDIDGILIIAVQDYWESQYYVPQYASSTTGTATLIGNTISYTQNKQKYGGFSYSKPRVAFECRFFDSKSNEYIWRATSITKGNAFANFFTLADSLASRVIYKLIGDLNFRKIKRNQKSNKRIPVSEKIPTDENAIKQELNRIESLFQKDLHNEAIHRMALLKDAIEQSESLDNKKKLLSKIHLIWGACYIEGKGRSKIGKEHIEKAIEYNPNLKIDKNMYGDEVLHIYKEITTKPFEEEKNKNQKISLNENSSKKYAAGSYVRVVKENAVLKLDPDKNSRVIKYLPLGAQLEVAKDLDNWIKVKLPPDKDGIIIVGFIQKFFIKEDNS